MKALILTLAAILTVSTHAQTKSECDQVRRTLDKNLSKDFDFNRFGAIYVGNGGQMTVNEGRPILRDFREMGMDSGLHFGERIDPAIAHELAGISLEKFGISKDLFARKLTDLQGASPHLGEYVLAAFRFYFWRFQLKPVLQVPRGFEEREYETIASRIGAQIRIFEPSWQRLDEEQKIGLILHEIYSGLLIPVCGSGRQCTQPLNILESLVAASFRPAHLSNSLVRAITDAHLNIPPVAERDGGFEVQPSQYKTTLRICEKNFEQTNLEIRARK